MSKTTVKAWHWLRADRTLGYGDGRRVEDGEVLTVDVEPVLCRRGLHASVWLVDALGYAPGPVLCRVEVGGEVLYGDGKIVGTSRKVLWSVEDEAWLWRACCRIGEWALEQELQAGRDVDPRSYAAIEARRAWLDGKRADLSAARSAAYWARSAADSAYSAAAAYSAAVSAADSAACSAADSAAYWAACSAADSAAYSAAVSAADSAACSAADSAAYWAAVSAAYSAAYSAADSAAVSAAYSAADSILLDELAQVVGEEALR